MASNTISILIQAKDQASKTIRSIGNELDDGSGRAQAYGAKWAAVGKVVAAASLAMGGAAILAGKYALTAAAEYEQSLNVFRSVSGATSADMAKVGAAARELGKDVSLPGVSAADAALAMVELSKAGLSVNDTLAASKGVLSLAKAGQLETAQAAEIAANALNAFSLDGKEATRVADLLAAAANASSADVTDMAYALQMSSAGAAAVKVPVEDLTTAIAAMANNGIKGSDAGTSLKSMFMNLIPTTDRAKKSMAALNLDFYDAKGNFVGLRDMVKQLQQGTKDLTDEQKAQHIENIFGADSMRAANVLIKEGVAGYDKLSKAVNKEGAAAKLAAAQNSGFKGSIDALQSSIETVAIDVGTKMLPALTSVAKQIANNIDPAFEGLKKGAKAVWSVAGPAVIGLAKAIQNDLVPGLAAVAKSDFTRYVGGAFVIAVTAGIRVLQGIVSVVGTFMQQTSSMTGVLVMAGVGFVAYNAVMSAVAIKVAAVTAAQTALNAVMRLNPVALVIAGAAGIVAGYMAVVSQTDRTSGATQRLTAAQNALKTSTDAAKAAQDSLRGALLSEEGAALAVERAQLNYNSAVAQFGSKSLQAREASFALKSAQDQLANAATAVRDRTNEARSAQEAQVRAKDAVVAANNAAAASAHNAAGGYAAMAANIRQAVAEGEKTGKLGAGITAGSNAALGIKGFSTGGYTGAGGTNEVAGVVHRGEYVIPKSQVNQSTGQPMIGGGGTVININGPINNQTPEAANAFWDRVDKTQRMARYGMAA